MLDLMMLGRPSSCDLQRKIRGNSISNIAAVAEQFFAPCEAGEGWEVCQAYCLPSAGFAAQSEPLADVRTLEEYTDWMKGLLSFMPDGRYVVRSFATDEDRKSVCAYGVFSATHTGNGGPCPPTGKRTTTDYVHVMDFAGDKIKHMTKIWNGGWAMKEPAGHSSRSCSRSEMTVCLPAIDC